MPVRHGSWACQSSEDATWAYDLETGRSLRLSGTLHDAFQAGRSPEARGLVPEVDALFESWTVDAPGLNLGDVLRGNGFRRLFLELTGRCNERCLHCYASSSPEVETALDRATIHSVIEDAAELQVEGIQFTGGDPLLSPELLGAVQYARRLGIADLEVYTNGLALRDKLLAALAGEGVRFALSIYSHDAATHDAITGTPGSWARTIRAVRSAVDLGCRVRVGVVVRNENEKHLPTLLGMLSDWGVSREAVSIDRERQVGRGLWDGVAVEGETYALGHDEKAGHSHVRSGKLAVTYSGAVVPCIFDRDTILGRLGSGVRLSTVLATRIRRLQQDHAKHVLPQLEQSLSCFECRERRLVLRRADWDNKADG